MNNEIKEKLNECELKKLLSKFIKSHSDDFFEIYATTNGTSCVLTSLIDLNNIDDECEYINAFIFNQKKKYHTIHVQTFLKNLNLLLKDLNNSHYQNFLDVNSRQDTTKKLDKKWNKYMIDYLAWDFNPDYKQT